MKTIVTRQGTTLTQMHGSLVVHVLFADGTRKTVVGCKLSEYTARSIETNAHKPEDPDARWYEAQERG